MNDSVSLLNIKNLNITAGQLPLVKNFNLELYAGECRVISAPTGSGKTSLFNYIAGILPEQDFTVTGQVQKAPGLKVSYAFQEPRLIPSLSALRNVMLPLENLTDPLHAESVARVWLERVKLSNKINEFPENLSGGEQQRTNLARAFAYSSYKVPEPVEGQYKNNLLLLDEPFSSQDKQNAQNIHSLIKEMLFLPNTAILVITHDPSYFNDNPIII